MDKPPPDIAVVNMYAAREDIYPREIKAATPACAGSACG